MKMKTAFTILPWTLLLLMLSGCGSSTPDRSSVLNQGLVQSEPTAVEFMSAAAMDSSGSNGSITDIESEQQFADLLSNQNKTILVDFYADWCGPCKQQAIILNDLNAELADDTSIVKVNTDQFPDLAKRYDVAALPTLVVIQQGRAAEKQVGLTDKARIKQILQ